MIEVTVQSPVEDIFQGKTSCLTLPGFSGSFQILKGHAAIMARLTTGDIEIEQEGKKVKIPIGGGILDFKRDKAIVIST